MTAFKRLPFHPALPFAVSRQLISGEILLTLGLRFEAWCAMQEATPKGLRPAEHDITKRYYIECILNGDEKTKENLIHMWKKKTPQEAHYVLSMPDVCVTNARDKEEQLKHIKALDDSVKDAFQEQERQHEAARAAGYYAFKFQPHPQRWYVVDEHEQLIRPNDLRSLKVEGPSGWLRLENCRLGLKATRRAVCSPEWQAREAASQEAREAETRRAEEESGLWKATKAVGTTVGFAVFAGVALYPTAYACFDGSTSCERLLHGNDAATHWRRRRDGHDHAADK